MTNDQEARHATLLRISAKTYVNYLCHKEDLEAAMLALLWAAFEQEAIAQGLTKWRGVVLGDDAMEEL